MPMEVYPMKSTAHGLASPVSGNGLLVPGSRPSVEGSGEDVLLSPSGGYGYAGSGRGSMSTTVRQSEDVEMGKGFREVK